MQLQSTRATRAHTRTHDHEAALISSSLSATHVSPGPDPDATDAKTSEAREKPCGGWVLVGPPGYSPEAKEDGGQDSSPPTEETTGAARNQGGERH